MVKTNRPNLILVEYVQCLKPRSFSLTLENLHLHIINKLIASSELVQYIFQVKCLDTPPHISYSIIYNI